MTFMERREQALYQIAGVLRHSDCCDDCYNNYEAQRRSIDAENEFLWDLRARLLREIQMIEQRITDITGITEFGNE